MMVRSENLRVGYKKRVVVDNINIKALKGQIIAILGPNGVGKSTILKSLAGLLAPLGGVVYLDGRRLDRISAGEMARTLAVVLTDPISPAMLTAFDIASIGRYPYTGFFGRLSKEDEGVVWEALRLVDAQDLADRYFSELSDGEKQKVLIARALAQEPEVIILDEPTSHLDIRYKVEVMGILRRMARERGVTVILSTHEVDLAMKACDLAMLVKDGGVVAFGPPEEILGEEEVSRLYDIKGAFFSSYLGGIEIRGGSHSIVFVVGGAGSATKIYRALAKRGFGIATGILPKNDIDWHTAHAIGARVISEEPYSEITPNSYSEALGLIEEGNHVVDSGFPIGFLNQRNVDLLISVARMGRKIYTLRRGEELKKIYGGGLSYVMPCHSISHLIEAILSTNNEGGF